MRIGLLLVAAIIASLWDAMPARAGGGLPCDPSLNSCVVIVVTDPGHGGDEGSGKGGGGAQVDPCALFEGYGYLLCKAGKKTGSWIAGPGAADFCYSIYDRARNDVTVVELNALLTEAGCPEVPPAYVPPSPATLALRAASGFVLPAPVIRRFPGGSAWTLRDGTPYTLVRIPTWFWTEASTWEPQSADAAAGGNWATVTAAPTLLTFAPGDGDAAVSCAGPGTPFDPQRDAVEGSWVPQEQPDGCDYRYPNTSAKMPGSLVTATLTITWSLTWTGSGNTSGTLTQRTTSSSASFAVAEAQSVVVR